MSGLDEFDYEQLLPTKERIWLQRYEQLLPAKERFWLQR